SSSRSPVYFVDHRVGWDRDSYLAFDRYHPNSAGMEKLAENWLASIEANQMGFFPKTSQYQPDQKIEAPGFDQIGNDIFGSGGGQRIVQRTRHGKKSTFFCETENDGNLRDTYRIRSSRKDRFFKVRISESANGWLNVTAATRTGRHRTTIDAGQTATFRLTARTTRKAGEKRRSFKTQMVATSESSPSYRDAVVARVQSRK
ncbi:MAG: hypothetical protein AAGC68_16365, partial [Verrucomicrobiota bacterium]